MAKGETVMSIDEAIIYLEDKITDIQTYGELAKEGLNLQNQEKVDRLCTKTIAVLNAVKEKAQDTAKRVPDDENFAAFLDSVCQKSDEAIAYTKRKIDEIIKLDDPEEKLKEAAEQIRNTFGEIKDNDEVKDMINSIKEVTASIYGQLEDYMTKPETQEIIKKAKVATVKIAEKGVSALKDLFKVEDDQ